MTRRSRPSNISLGATLIRTASFIILEAFTKRLRRSRLAIEQLKKIKPDSKLFSDAVLHVAYLLKQEQKVDEAKSYLNASIEKSPNVANFYVFEASMEEDAKN